MNKPAYPKLAIIAAIVFITCISSCSLTASANPPSKVECSYDFPNQTLTVTITHAVDNPATHFIYLVSIVKNSAHREDHTYTSQPTRDTFTYKYHIAANDSDVIGVTATCVLYGSGSAQVTVKKGATATGTSSGAPQLWPVHAALMTSGFALILAGTSFIYMKKKSWWFRAHKVVGTVGALLSVCGLSVAIYMVSAGGGAHFRVMHAYLGAATLTVVLMSPVLGVLWSKTTKPSIRTAHIWLCRTAIVLMAVTIVMGLVTAGVI